MFHVPEEFEELRQQFLKEYAAYDGSYQMVAFQCQDTENALVNSGRYSFPCNAPEYCDPYRACAVLLPMVGDAKVPFESFQRLAARAWAFMPREFAAHLLDTAAEVDSLAESAYEHWVWFLCWMVSPDDVDTLENPPTQCSRDPFLASVTAIENCGLNTESPRLPDYIWENSNSIVEKTTEPTAPADGKKVLKRTKRSTERGEARAKIIAHLTLHHNYADGGCLIQEFIGNNELARGAEVSESTASTFFNKEFNHGETGGHAKYKVICRDPGRLADSLKALNGEFSPHDLYGRRPPGEENRNDED